VEIAAIMATMPTRLCPIPDADIDVDRNSSPTSIVEDPYGCPASAPPAEGAPNWLHSASSQSEGAAVPKPPPPQAPAAPRGSTSAESQMPTTEKEQAFILQIMQYKESYKVTKQLLQEGIHVPALRFVASRKQ
jgi:hypothetical protein